MLVDDLHRLTVSGWSVIYELNNAVGLVTIVAIRRSET
jgi:hypothetical protein